jgi:hypothetical protein
MGWRETLERKDKMATSDIQQRFEEFHEANPQVFYELAELATQAWEKGRTRISIETLYNHLRWEHWMNTDDPASDYKLNDHYTSRYARKIMEEFPLLDGIFETRDLRS